MARLTLDAAMCEGHGRCYVLAPELFETSNFYYRAVVDILVKSKGHIKSKIW